MTDGNDMSDEIEDEREGNSDRALVRRARDRFRRCVEWEADARAKFVSDLRFANADPDNGWQWPQALWSTRQDDPKGYTPKLTINKVRQHNLQIINDAKQNKPGIVIRPVSDDASFKAAQVFEDIVRDIERQSRAEQAYDTATQFQVQCGLGYIRVVTDYAGPNTFDQEIFIRRVKNPLNVYLDPDINEVDGSDARFGFVYDDVPKDEFLSEYPEMKGKIGQGAPLDEGATSLDDKHVRVLEYFEKEMVRDELWLMRDPDSGQTGIARKSEIPAEVRKRIAKDDILKRREILDPQIKWYKIADDEVLDVKDWPGRYIPIVPVVGEQTIVEKKLDRKGHTRAMKDAQRMYNFWSSSATEQAALQTKTRWFVPVGATENLETYFAKINTTNLPFIPYNSVNSEGEALPPPTPINPPVLAPAYVQLLQISQNELMMASGQYQSQFGQNENATSGKAIAERQRQGDNATYHFIDGLAIAIRQVGNIVVDLIPKIYDTARVKQIMGKDGTQRMVRIDPAASQSYAEEQMEEQEAIYSVFNPNVGRYQVESDIGPSYSTRRQEAWNAFVQITSQNRELTNVIGDLMFRYADFPGADDIAERLARIVPPNVKGEAPDPALQQAIAQNANLQKLYAESLEKIATMDRQAKDKEDQKEINLYDAESRRLKEIGNATGNLGPDVLKPLIQELLQEMLDPANVPVINDEAVSDQTPDASSAQPEENAA